MATDKLVIAINDFEPQNSDEIATKDILKYVGQDGMYVTVFNTRTGKLGRVHVAYIDKDYDPNSQKYKKTVIKDPMLDIPDGKQFKPPSKLPHGTFFIKSSHNNLFLDCQSEGKVDGTYIVVNDYSGKPSQKWQCREDGFILNKNSGLVLDIQGQKGPYTIIYQNNGGANQIWSYQKKGENAGEIISHLDKRRLDVQGESMSPGTYVVVWERTGKTNQKWELVPA